MLPGGLNLPMGPTAALVVEVAAAALMLLVALLLITQVKRGKNNFAREISLLTDEETLELGNRINKLEAQIEILLEMNENLKERLLVFERHFKDLQDKNFNVTVNGASRSKSSIEIAQVHEEIYRAYDSGMQVGDLAQEFGRGKGEIEFILNLRRMKT